MNGPNCEVDMPYKYVEQLIRRCLEQSSWPEIGQMTSVSENTLRNILEGKTNGHHNKLIQVVHELEGITARNDFVTSFKNYSAIFEAAFSFIEPDKENRGRYPEKGDLLDPKIYEVLLYTGSDHGVCKKRLGGLLPHRSEELECLMSRGVVVEENGRLYSDFKNDPSMMFQVIKTKLELRTGVSKETDFAYNIFAGDETFDQEGIVKLFKLVSEFASSYRQIKKDHSTSDGIQASLNGFVTTFGIDSEIKDKILTDLGDRK